MPNWTYNDFRFDSPKDLDLFKKALVSKDDNGEEIVDFNKLIPMPESLDIEAGYRENVAIMCYVTDKLQVPYKDLDADKKVLLLETIDFIKDFNDIQKEIVNRVNEYDDTKDNLYKSGKQYVENYKKYGYTTWFGWRWTNWGVKWNASESQIFDDGVLFNTPWSEPAPIIIALIKKYPEINFILNCEYEDMFGQPPRVFIYKDKTLRVVELVYPQKGSKKYNEFLEEDSIYCDEGEDKAFNPDDYYNAMFSKGLDDNFSGLEWTEIYKAKEDKISLRDVN